ncbi:MAG: OprO/OprP family phosphate-selective porin [Planctomycetota bacterium]
MLTGIISCGASVAMGQQGYSVLPTDPGYTMAVESAPANNYLVSNSSFADDGEKGLEARVKELESALKKIKDKEAADKKKAAGSPSVKFGGRIFFDTVGFGQNQLSRDTFGDAQDATYFRTARFFAEGEGFDVMFYKAEFDFAGRADFTTSSALDDPLDHTHTVSGVGQVLWKDVYIGIKELPILGSVRAGHFKEPLSLEQLTSSRFITFMERSLADTLVPGRNVGVMAMRVADSENATFAIGAFQLTGENPPFRENDDLGLHCTMRGTWLPWYDECSDGRGLLHLGLGYSYVDFDNPNQRLRARPEIAVGPRVVDTGTFNLNENAHLINPEVAWVYGPLSIQTEYVGAFYDRTGGAEDAYFNGAYVFVSYFLTGENRGYKRSSGAFDRVKPFENFFHVRAEDGCCYTGKGAWELAYRYSYLDLDDTDAAILGGFAGDHTFGVNWYLNPYTRLMFNYIHSDVSARNNGPSTDIDVFAARAQVDF